MAGVDWFQQTRLGNLRKLWPEIKTMKTAEPIMLTGIYDLLLSGWSWVPEFSATLRDMEGNLYNVYNRRDRSYLFPVRDSAMEATPPSDRK